MNETRSSSIRRTPSSGSQAAMSTAGIPAADGISTPLSSPETCASGAGMSTASLWPSPCTPDHERRLVPEAAMGVQRRLGHPGRPRGEQHDGDVAWPGRGSGAGGHWQAPDRATSNSASGPVAAGDERARASVGRGHVPRAPGPTPGAPDRARPTPRRPQPVVQGCRHGAEAPARPVEQERRGAVGQLPAHDVPAPDTGRAQPRRQVATRRRTPASNGAGPSTDREASPRDAPAPRSGVDAPRSQARPAAGTVPLGLHATSGAAAVPDASTPYGAGPSGQRYRRTGCLT